MSSTFILLFEYLGIALVMMFIPFIHIIYAIVEKKDVDPLSVNLNYSKDPRYMAKKFEEYFFNSINMKILKLHSKCQSDKLGLIEICNKSTTLKTLYDGILYLPNKMKLQERTTVKHQILSESDIELLDYCHAGAIRSKGEITLHPHTSVSRWLDADLDIYIGQNCCVNIISTPKSCVLSLGTKMKRVYASPIYTSKNLQSLIPIASIQAIEVTSSDIKDNLLYLTNKVENIDNDKEVTSSIVSKHQLNLGDRVHVYGDIKSNHNLHIGEDCIINGNIFAEGNIIISKNCFIAGNIFSHQSIYISEGCQIASKDHTKSIIAKQEIKLEKNITIYNYILSDKGIEIV